MVVSPMYTKKKLKASFEEKYICVKFLFKHNNEECYWLTAKYVFQTQKVQKSVCKCEKGESKNGGTKIQTNSSINNIALGSVGFDTEVVTIRNEKKMKQVQLTYDSFASHTTLNSVLKDELRLDTTYIGDLNIQTNSGIFEEKGYQKT